MPSKTWIAFGLAAALAAGCGHEEASEKFATVQLPQETRDFYLPSQLWDQLLIEDHDNAGLDNLKVNEDETLQSRAIALAPVVVELVEKNQGVLTAPRIRVELAKGGGTIDLAKFKGPRAGTFHVRFDFEGLTAPSYNIMYLSQGRQRKVDDMLAGAGCRAFFNVTDAVSKYYKDGIPVNTTRDLHVSALAGHFLMGWVLNRNMSVTQVRFVDSSREDLICPPLKNGGAR